MGVGGVAPLDWWRTRRGEEEQEEESKVEEEEEEEEVARDARPAARKARATVATRQSLAAREAILSTPTQKKTKRI